MKFTDFAEAGAVLGVALIYVMNEVRKIVASRKSKHVGLDKNLVIDSQIYPIMWELMVSFRAMRCYITQFHNGSTFYTGQSIQRMTVSHEVILHRTFLKVKDNNDNVLISEMEHRILMDIKTCDYYWVADVDELRTNQHNEVIADWMDVYNAKAMYIFRIVDKKSKETVATLNLHFNHKHPLSDIDVGFILETKKRLEAIFDKL